MVHDERAKAEGLVLSPKMSFLLGLAGGILILCTIGFFILLAIMLKGAKPGSVVDAADTAAKPSAAAPAPTAEEPEPTIGTIPPVTDADFIRGDKNAKITLVEYSDFECPYCQRFHNVMLQVMDEYKGQVRWVFRSYPLSFHPNAMPAANAAACAGEQGKFWEFADKLYENQSSLGDAMYTQIATELKLNMSKFNACYKAAKYQSNIEAERDGGSAAGISGTPGTVIVGKDGSQSFIPGALPFEQVKPMIDAKL
ncbi:MAG: thioredoxin domain-containing protein [Patescibacteria group bacterium]|nr:thioredoxin domain-containing protein [Patescibacteria group bacterium]